MKKNMILPLHEIIGISVMDVVRAESHAAQVSMEFIQSVGFKGSDGDDSLGELRMVSFWYRDLDEDGKEVKREARVPLLSLVPLPILHISKCEIDLAGTLVGVSEMKLNTPPAWCR